MLIATHMAQFSTKVKELLHVIIKLLADETVVEFIQIRLFPGLTKKINFLFWRGSNYRLLDSNRNMDRTCQRHNNQ